MIKSICGCHSRVLLIHAMKTVGIVELFQGLKSLKRWCYAAADAKGIYSSVTWLPGNLHWIRISGSLHRRPRTGGNRGIAYHALYFGGYT